MYNNVKHSYLEFKSSKVPIQTEFKMCKRWFFVFYLTSFYLLSQQEEDSSCKHLFEEVSNTLRKIIYNYDIIIPILPFDEKVNSICIIANKYRKAVQIF